MIGLNTEVTQLEIQKLPEGGYMVMPARGYNQQGMFWAPLFACTTIEEALKYIKGKLK